MGAGAARGEKNPKWKGGVKYDNGYRKLLRPEHLNARRGYVSEHVLVMSEHLGRALTAEEVVHHINGDKLDNRLENLELMSRAAHTSHHHKGVVKPNSIVNLVHKGRTREEMLKAWQGPMLKYRKKPRPCLECGKEYLGQRSKQRYCGRSCSLLADSRKRTLSPVLAEYNRKRKKVPRICPVCTTEFIYASKANQVCCSKSCATKYKWTQGAFANR